MIHLTTPLNPLLLKDLKVGNKVFISGTIYTARDQAHIRLIKDMNPSFDLNNAIIYYVGPTPEKPGHVIGSSGPTSSYRMDNLSIPLMERGVKVMIGKGDRSELFRKSMVTHGAIYLIATGGAGALLASTIVSRKTIMYEDLGTESIQELSVKNFPCFVAYDLNNGNIFVQSDSLK